MLLNFRRILHNLNFLKGYKHIHVSVVWVLQSQFREIDIINKILVNFIMMKKYVFSDLKNIFSALLQSS